MRTIEMYICWPDGTWDAEHFVSIPASTPENEIVRNGKAVRW